MELTPRQREIAELVAEGKREQEIADALGVKLQTVKNHKQRIYRKLIVRNAVELTNALNGGRS